MKSILILNPLLIPNSESLILTGPDISLMREQGEIFRHQTQHCACCWKPAVVCKTEVTVPSRLWLNVDEQHPHCPTLRNILTLGFKYFSKESIRG